MSYAPADRDYYDADSHIMELPNFLTSYADPKIRDQIPEVSYSASLVTDEEVEIIMSQGDKHSAEHIQNQLELGDDLIAESKEIQALGAFDSTDRSDALDLLGFKQQLVFATHSVAFPFHPSSKNLLSCGMVLLGLITDMVDFCSDDERMLGVGIVPLDDPEYAIAEAEWAIDNGLKAIWVPHRAPIDRSPGHVELEPFWQILADSNTPFVLHVGGSPLQVLGSWSNNGRAATKDWMGGGENVRTKDAALLHQPPETFVSMLVLDGVLERHSRLKGAAVELGAGWVPELIRRLDWVSKVYSRVDESVRFERPPSEQIKEQLAFTPFHHEDVKRLIEDSHEDLYLFSSDYPHVEGTKDPIGRFERFISDLDEDLKDKFYSGNFLRIWSDSRV